jgi:gliding motility-associated-like protein
MKNTIFFKAILTIVFLTNNATYANTIVYPLKKETPNEIKKSTRPPAKSTPINLVANAAPIIRATGNQIYCPQTSIKIVTDVTITDSDDTSTAAIYIQISSGYVNGQDQLTLTGSHPTITTFWDPPTGKLKLYSPTGIDVTYTDFVNAIKDIQFYNPSPSPSGIRNFSISIGQANFLPRNGHFYQFISNVGITWTTAKDAAESIANNYYGLQGYLATITAADEAKISGEQAAGAGWIGGSDAETEGVWKWVTGPVEERVVFWNGLANGSSPTYSLWNSNEPNQAGEEDYAHITAPGVGTLGSWNDLSNTGASSGTYQPKGYIVEYGGMPGDPILQIAASTAITIPIITTTTAASRCGSGTVTLQATASNGTVNWYDDAGNAVAVGNNYTTPILSTTTTYYVDAGCSTAKTPIIATINTIPAIISTNTPVSRCGSGSVQLQATATIGIINWYSSATGTNIAATGANFTTPTLTQNTTYYAEAVNNGCVSLNRIPVDITIYAPPAATDQEVALCKSSTVTLDASLAGMTYLWSTGEETQTISVASPGTYTVAITNSASGNCTSIKKISVVEPAIPEIDRVDVNETTVVIYLKNAADYFEYSVDGINYQSSNVFFNVPSGLQTAYVRELNNCSFDSKNFIVLIIPTFFTPNNDSYNDLWEVAGLINYPQAEVTVFDRYGKLIIQLNASRPTWDGTLNKKALPASDYWYVLKIDPTKPEVSGHFTLKR